MRQGPSLIPSLENSGGCAIRSSKRCAEQTSSAVTFGWGFAALPLRKPCRRLWGHKPLGIDCYRREALQGRRGADLSVPPLHVVH